MINLKNFLPLEKQLCFAVYETASEFNKLYSTVLQPFGLTYPQYLVLLALWEKDAVTVKELGEKLNLGTGTLTPMITRMVESDWLKKERSKTDERKVHIYLQPKALQEQQEIMKKVTEEILTCHIELREYEQLMQQLNQLHHKIKKRTGN